jgi:hypothetical protein
VDLLERRGAACGPGEARPVRAVPRLLIILAAGALVAALVATGVRAGRATAATPTVALSALNGATVPRTFALVVDVPRATSAKLVVDGNYVGTDQQLPLGFSLTLGRGRHELKVRALANGREVRTDVAFTVADNAPAPTTTTSTTSSSTTTSSTTSTTRPPTTTTSTTAPTVPGGPGEQVVDTVEEIRAALATAKPGSVIRVADGSYEFKPRLVASANGTAKAPITLRGSRDAILRTKNTSGDYGLHVTGDYWRVEGVTVAHATKGIVLDGSVGTVIDGVEVYDIGDEGVHFRSCSSDGVLRRSSIHDTGRNSPQYGEGVYVGSANSNWSSFRCTDRVEGGSGKGDNTERVLIEDNVISDTTAEGVDLKEGTDSGTLRRNQFRRTGASGLNSADSAVDAKGNGWVIEDNVVSESTAPWDDDGVDRPSKFADGFQAHSVVSGYGTGNTFRRNRVVGAVPGFGVGMYPGLANKVTCDNAAPGAAKGLVGDNSKPATCSP